MTKPLFANEDEYLDARYIHERAYWQSQQDVPEDEQLDEAFEKGNENDTEEDTNDGKAPAAA